MKRETFSTVCVIIAAKGSGETLEACLQSVVTIDYPSYEIILVDDGLDDKARSITNKYNDKIHIIKNTGAGPSSARNCGVKICRADYVAFFDADCIVDKCCLTELVCALEKYPDAAGSGGIQLLPSDATPFQKLVYRFLKKLGFVAEYSRSSNNKQNPKKVHHNPSCNALYKRDAFLEIGGFKENLWPGEDVELDYRLVRSGYLLIWNPQAIVYHYRVGNVQQFSRMMYRYGRAQGQLVRMYGLFRNVQFMPFLTMIMLAITASLAIFRVHFFIMLAAGSLLLSVFWLELNAGILKLFFVALVYWNAGFWNGILMKLSDKEIT
ncbi:MAG: glycosyltransferase [Chitinispirillaceae bacterium]|nr:glycosyltransferase [Chitinispirillaceae bacterium]